MWPNIVAAHCLWIVDEMWLDHLTKCWNHHWCNLLSIHLWDYWQWKLCKVTHFLILMEIVWQWICSITHKLLLSWIDLEVYDITHPLLHQTSDQWTNRLSLLTHIHIIVLLQVKQNVIRLLQTKLGPTYILLIVMVFNKLDIWSRVDHSTHNLVKYTAMSLLLSYTLNERNLLLC